jgi:hypothetical protein
MKKYFVLSLFLVMAFSTLLLNFACQPTVTGPGFPAALKTAIASYTPVPTGTQSPTSTPQPTATPCVGVMGDSNFESNFVVVSSSTLYLNRTIANATTVLNSFSLGVTGGTGEFKGAVYTDNAGTAPQSLIGETIPQSFTAGFNSVTFASPVSVTSGTPYWLGFISNGNIAANTSAVTASTFLATQTGLSITGTLPVTFTGTASSSTTLFSDYVCP